ncbi:MAG TPA: hypothetical protein DEA69_14595, partial [Microbacterium sp.]|nr:hypothetical protein [Microbacterium sp.]
MRQGCGIGRPDRGDHRSAGRSASELYPRLRPRHAARSSQPPRLPRPPRRTRRPALAPRPARAGVAS